MPKGQVTAAQSQPIMRGQGWPTRTATSCASDLRCRRGKPRA